MTGAGRSTAAKELEDLGYFVVDNLPPELVGRRGAPGRRQAGRRPAGRGRGRRPGRGLLRRPCASSSRPSSRPGAPRCSSSRPTTTSWSAARRPPGDRTRSRARGRLLEGIARERAVMAEPAGRRRPGHRHDRAQRPPAQGQGRDAFGTPEARQAADHGGQLRVQVRRPGRRRPDGRHAVPAEPVLGAGAASADRPGRRRGVVREGPAPTPRSSSSATSGDRDRRRRLPARGQAVHDGGDRLHRRQAPQRRHDPRRS